MPVTMCDPTDDDIEEVDLTATSGAMPCPFCGEAQRLMVLVGVGEASDGARMSGVGCNGCASLGPLVDGGVGEAVTAWNRRAAGAMH